MEFLLALDQQLFALTSLLPHTGLTVSLALVLSGVGTAGIIWFIIAGVLFFREKKKDHWFFLPPALVGGASWAIVELLLKPLVGRVRPDGSDGFSFPSGHATIAFAMAVVLTRKEPRWRWLFFALALFIAVSRVFLAKHYPLDVTAGALLGWLIGLFSLYATQR